MAQEHRVIILGSGPAGNSAAIYLARAGFEPLVISGPEPGGQALFAGRIDNYAGFPDGVGGFELWQQMRAQAQKLGAVYLDQAATAVDFSKSPYKIWTNLPPTINFLHLAKYKEAEWRQLREEVTQKPHDLETNYIVIATGGHAKMLGLPEEDSFIGRGLSSCATCDGPFYKDKHVAVVGAGDSAVNEVLFLAELAKKVTLIHRGKTWKSQHYHKLKRLNSLCNIECIWDRKVIKLEGDLRLEKILTQDVETGIKHEISVDGLFLAIGHLPNVGLFHDQLEISLSGHIATDAHKGVNTLQTRTNKAGIFAAGDVTSPFYNQVSVAVASGAMAAMDLIEYNTTTL